MFNLSKAPFLAVAVSVAAVAYAAPAFAMEVFARTADGEKMSLNVEPETSILLVKRMCARNLGVSESRVVLFVGRDELEDDHTIAFYNIRASDTIDVVVREEG